MPRPSLTAALIRLAQLRTQRDGLAIERRRIVVRDEPDRAERLRAEIRRARSIVDVLRAGRTMARAG